MKSIVTSPCDQQKIPGSKISHLNYETTSRVRSGTLGTIGSNSTSTPVNCTHKSIIEDSTSSSCVGRNTRAISIDLSINSSPNDTHRGLVIETISRTGRKLQAAAIAGEKEHSLSSVKRFALSCEVDKKDKHPPSNSNSNEDNDGSSGLPKRLHRLSLSLPSSHTAGELYLHSTHSQVSGSSPVSDLGSRVFFQNDNVPIVSPSSQTHPFGVTDIRTPNSKSKRVERSKVNSDGSTPTSCRNRLNDDDIHHQNHKLMSIDIGVTETICSPGGKSPKVGKNALSQVKKDGTINVFDSTEASLQLDVLERKESKEKVLSVCVENLCVEKNDTEKTCAKNIFDNDLVAKYSTPTKPRCARFVEVEVQKIDYGNGGQIMNDEHIMISNPFQTGNGIAKNDLSSLKSDNYNLIIRDANVAFKNDKILRDKFLEAKSLNRRNETGATMHNFSLWGGSKSNSNSSSTFGDVSSTVVHGKESTDGSECSSPRDKSKSKVHSEQNIVNINDPMLPGGLFSHGSFVQPKYSVKSPGKTRSPCKHPISKLRGPMAARGKFVL